MIIIHRINTIEELKKIPSKYGVEIDVRGFGNKLLLSHEPIDSSKKYDELEEYLKFFNHSFIVFNVKEAGYEKKIIELAEKYGVNDYFLLDVEFPFIYKSTRVDNFRKIALRYSEAEPIEFIESQNLDGKALADWVWIDTITLLPLSNPVIAKLSGFKTCLVCPERWGRPEDIQKYIGQMKGLNFKLDAVMTSLKYAPLWEGSGILSSK